MLRTRPPMWRGGLGTDPEPTPNRPQWSRRDPIIDPEEILELNPNRIQSRCRTDSRNDPTPLSTHNPNTPRTDSEQSPDGPRIDAILTPNTKCSPQVLRLIAMWAQNTTQGDSNGSRNNPAVGALICIRPCLSKRAVPHDKRDKLDSHDTNCVIRRSVIKYCWS